VPYQSLEKATRIHADVRQDREKCHAREDRGAEQALAAAAGPAVRRELVALAIMA
jgi:hypothetical protein